MAEISAVDAWFASAKGGRDDEIKGLVGSIKDVNITDSLGNTALHYAAAGNHTTVVQELLKLKVNVNAKNKQGETPAHKVHLILYILKEKNLSFFFLFFFLKRPHHEVLIKLLQF